MPPDCADAGRVMVPTEFSRWRRLRRQVLTRLRGHHGYWRWESRFARRNPKIAALRGTEAALPRRSANPLDDMDSEGIDVAVAVDVEPVPSIVVVDVANVAQALYVTVLDRDGNLRWAQTFGGAGNDQGLGVAIANAVGVQANSAPASWIVAVVGAAVLIGILRALGVSRFA